MSSDSAMGSEIVEAQMLIVYFIVVYNLNIKSFYFV